VPGSPDRRFAASLCAGLPTPHHCSTEGLPVARRSSLETCGHSQWLGRRPATTLGRRPAPLRLGWPHAGRSVLRQIPSLPSTALRTTSELAKAFAVCEAVGPASRTTWGGA
jgi:hypothetical protein